MHREPKLFHNGGAAGFFRPLFPFRPFQYLPVPSDSTCCSLPDIFHPSAISLSSGFSVFLSAFCFLPLPFSPPFPFPSVFPDTVPPAKRGPGPVPGHTFPKSKNCIMPITYIPLALFFHIHTRIQNTYIQKTPRKNITLPTEKTTILETTPRARIRIYGNMKAEKTGSNDKKTAWRQRKLPRTQKPFARAKEKSKNKTKR